MDEGNVRFIQSKLAYQEGDFFRMSRKRIQPRRRRDAEIKEEMGFTGLRILKKNPVHPVNPVFFSPRLCTSAVIFLERGNLTI